MVRLCSRHGDQSQGAGIPGRFGRGVCKMFDRARISRYSDTAVLFLVKCAMLRLVLLAALLVLATGVFAPRSARATCGDWLAHPSGTTQSNPSGTDLSGEDDSGAAGSRSAVGLPAEPCRGPGCRQAPAAPLPLPSLPMPEQTQHELACLLDSSISRPVPAAWENDHARLQHLRGHKSDVYRPPRFS